MKTKILELLIGVVLVVFGVMFIIKVGKDVVGPLATKPPIVAAPNEARLAPADAPPKIGPNEINITTPLPASSGITSLVNDTFEAGMMLGYAAANLGASKDDILFLIETKRRNNHASLNRWFDEHRQPKPKSP